MSCWISNSFQYTYLSQKQAYNYILSKSFNVNDRIHETNLKSRKYYKETKKKNFTKIFSFDNTSSQFLLVCLPFFSTCPTLPKVFAFSIDERKDFTIFRYVLQSPWLQLHFKPFCALVFQRFGVV